MEIFRVGKSRLPSIDFEKLGFGEVFADHMISMEYRGGHWSTPTIHPFGMMRVSPALFALHYGQSIFEGMKAFATRNGNINIFRPDMHIERFNKSARRLGIPEIAPDIFITILKELVQLDREWVPKKQDSSLYIRPVAFAAEEYLGLRTPHRFRFFIITSPVGTYYNAPVTLRTSGLYARAVRGGVGDTKTSGNYASCMMPTEEAQRAGFDQILWLDAQQRAYVEEAGTMNIFFVIDDVLVTAPLEGTILPGVTRASVLTIARVWGIPVEERRLTINEVFESYRRGELKEAFGTGTAAVITPISEIEHNNSKITLRAAIPGSLSLRLRQEIIGIQYGDIPDRYGWCYQV